jgi:hypothetical protein
LKCFFAIFFLPYKHEFIDFTQLPTETEPTFVLLPGLSV